MFRSIEEKIKHPENNIVEESIMRSMFGIFARSYKIFCETQPNDIDLICRKAFKGSYILDDVQRVMLYYNLPYNPIIKEKVLPTRIFPVSNSPDGNTI